MPDTSPAIAVVEPRAEKPRSRLFRAALARLHLGVLAIVAAGIAAPVAAVSHGTERARACLATFTAARGPDLPDCRDEIRWLVTPSRIPWTATAARYRAEEINMRQAVATYTDAAIGKPDAQALGRASEGLFAAEKVIRAGSQRVTLDELGRAVGAPDPGRSAILLGDRRTLLAKSDLWPHWSVRMRTLEAALLEGDMPRAEAIAKRYAEFDPRDDDLRATVAAALCLFGDGKRGLELLATIQTARAKDRHEAWARNWGEIRGAIVACAAKAGVPPPPLPERDGAGVADLVDARTALRLRLLSTTARARDPFAARDAATGAIDLLEKGPMTKGARVRILAGLLGLGRTLEPDLAATLATPHTDGEPALLGHPMDLTAVEWLEHPRGLHVITPPEALRDAAVELRRMAALEDTTAADREKLLTAAAAATFAAARGFAIAGDPGAAVAAIDAAPDLGPAAHLARSSAWYVVSNPLEALAALDRAQTPGLVGGDPQTPGPAGRDGADPALAIAWHIQRAEILASLDRRDDAAREAVLADDLAARLQTPGAAALDARDPARRDRRLDLRAQWTRLALARSRRSSVPASSTRAFPWVGPMATPGSWLDPAAESPDAFAAALAFWDAARAGPLAEARGAEARAAERRAMRYAVVEPHAGDAPRARAMHLALAADLLAPGEGDVEVWLDAVGATAGRSTTMRAYAFARMEAARIRRDLPAAAAWANRYAELVKLAAPAENAELAAVLGI